MKKVTVRWVDSASTPGWTDVARKDWGTVECESTGYLVEKSRKRLTLALSRTVDNNRACDFMSIPASCVRSIKAVK